MSRQHLLAFAAWLAYRLLAATWRTRVAEHPSVTSARQAGRPRIMAHWHGDELALLQLVGRYRIATMTSTSTDGQIVDQVIRRLGGRTCRGSSQHRGIAALKGLVRLSREGCNASVATDGPRGPRHRVKPGVFQVARLSGGAIVPVGIAVDRAHVFRNAWNRARLPRPFARMTIYFGPVIEPAHAQGDGHAGSRRTLAAAIHRAGRCARGLRSEPAPAARGIRHGV